MSARKYFYGTEQSETIRVEASESFNFVYGKGGDDILIGSSGREVLEGGSGDDSLSGRAGNDYLEGGLGNDDLYGGSGDDDLRGGEGNDHLWGGNGADYLQGGDGNDYINGGAGDDFIDAFSGNNYLVGGDGADVFELGIEPSNNDRDVILDFELGVDRLTIFGVNNSFDINQSGNDTEITYSGSINDNHGVEYYTNTLTLIGVNSSDIDMLTGSSSISIV